MQLVIHCVKRGLCCFLIIYRQTARCRLLRGTLWSPMDFRVITIKRTCGSVSEKGLRRRPLAHVHPSVTVWICDESICPSVPTPLVPLPSLPYLEMDM